MHFNRKTCNLKIYSWSSGGLDQRLFYKNRIKVSCSVYLFLVSLETSWIFRHWISVALLWVWQETLAVNQRNNTVIKTCSNQFQRINTVMWQDEEPGSMTPNMSPCQHFFNSLIIKCNNLGEFWAINRTHCDPRKWVTGGLEMWWTGRTTYLLP